MKYIEILATEKIKHSQQSVNKQLEYNNRLGGKNK